MTGKTIAEKTIADLLSSISGDSGNESIHEFLARPVVIQRGVFGSSDTATTFTPFQLPNQAMTPLVQEKMKGFFGFTATSVLTLQINGNPFQSGRYMLYFIPIGGARGNDPVVFAKVQSHENTLTARTQLPRIELDVNCDTQGQLRIPYVSCHAFTPLVATTSGVPLAQVAWVRIAPYVPVYSPAGSNTVPYTLWHHFEDVKLIGAAAPQMASLSSRELSKSGKGPLESTALSVSRITGLLSNAPGLSAYARPVRWLADLTAATAQNFGWSKPADAAPVMRSLRTTAPYMGNINAVDTGFCLGAITDNEVSVLPGFGGTDSDELDIVSLATRPAHIHTATWSTSDVYGDTLVYIPMCPNPKPKVRTIAGAIEIVDNIPSAFVSELFQYWRGSIVITIKMVKTKFHSGRLLISFSPTVYAIGTVVPTIDNSSYEFRTIVDVREESTLTVQIPYTCSQQYLMCKRQGSPVNEVFGTVTVRVLDPLVAPATVGNSIQLLIESSMGPDCEFAVPYRTNLLPVFGATPEMGDPCSITNSTIGSSSIQVNDGLMAAACMGEKIVSVRQLLKTFTVLQPFVAPTTARSAVNLIPFGSQVLTVGEGLPEHSGDLYSALSGCFTMARGGVRFKVLIPSNAGAWAWCAALYQSSPALPPVSPEYAVAVRSDTNFAGEGPGFTGTLNQTGYSMQPAVVNGCAEFTVPHYSTYHSRPCASHMVGDTFAYNTELWSTANRSRVSLFNPQASKAAYLVTRGGSDDINFSGFISVPPMYRGIATSYTY